MNSWGFGGGAGRVGEGREGEESDVEGKGAGRGLGDIGDSITDILSPILK